MRSISLLSVVLFSGCQFFLSSLDEKGNCQDGLDNDNNNAIDCADVACSDDTACALTCGDGALDAAEQCDDGNTFDGDGCSGVCVIEVAPPNCGDGVLNADEECDDGNTASGDGCSNLCRVEATFFVDCTAQLAGDGSIAAPFNTFSAAINASLDNQTQQIVLLGGVCDADVDIVNKQLFIVSRGATLNLLSGGNLSISNNASVILENVTLSGADEIEAALEFLDGAIQLRDNAELALIHSKLSFSDDGDTSPDAHCLTGENGSTVVIDRSELLGCAGGAIELNASSGFIANTLFQNNGGVASAHGALVESALAPNGFLVFGSVFDGNVSVQPSVTTLCSNGLTVEGSILNNNNSLPFFLSGVGCDINTSDTFGTTPPGGNNISVDPLFEVGSFHLSVGSPCIGAVAVPSVAPFDTNTLFASFSLGALDLFGHDFDGQPRLSPLDMGLFED